MTVPKKAADLIVHAEESGWETETTEFDGQWTTRYSDGSSYEKEVPGFAVVGGKGLLGFSIVYFRNPSSKRWSTGKVLPTIVLYRDPRNDRETLMSRFGPIEAGEWYITTIRNFKELLGDDDAETIVTAWLKENDEAPAATRASSEIPNLVVGSSHAER